MRVRARVQVRVRVRVRVCVRVRVRVRMRVRVRLRLSLRVRTCARVPQILNAYKKATFSAASPKLKHLNLKCKLEPKALPSIAQASPKHRSSIGSRSSAGHHSGIGR